MLERIKEFAVLSLIGLFVVVMVGLVVVEIVTPFIKAAWFLTHMSQ